MLGPLQSRWYDPVARILSMEKKYLQTELLLVEKFTTASDQNINMVPLP